MSSGITVVIPFHNLGRYLGETLESVYRQTLRPEEIVIVDDGSTDPQSIEFLAALEQRPNPLPIRILRQPNGRMSAARNAGIRAARSEFILPLDADDLISEDLLERVLPLMREPGVGFITTHMLCFGESLEPYVFATKAFDLSTCMVRNDTSTTSLFRRRAWEQVGGFDEAMRLGYEDWDFWIRLGKAGWQSAIIEEPLYAYRRRPDSNYMACSKDEAHREILAYLYEKHADLVSRFHRELLAEQERELHWFRKTLRQPRPERRPATSEMIRRFQLTSAAGASR